MSQFPISYVSAETGVNPITLRVWENRYRLVQPSRTASGHRLYTLEDIERIKKILYLKSKGHRMSEMRTLLSKEPNLYHQTLQKSLPNIIDYIERFQAKMLRETLMGLLTSISIEDFADQVYPIILEKLKQALWQNSIYFTLERSFFFDQLRNTLQVFNNAYDQDDQDIQVRIIGYEAPKEISEFYVNNLFLALLCNQYHINVCLVNHIDLFEEILEKAKESPRVVHIIMLGNDAYQFNQCIHVVLNNRLDNVVISHSHMSLENLSSEQCQIVLPNDYKHKMGFINRRLASLARKSKKK